MDTRKLEIKDGSDSDADKLEFSSFDLDDELMMVSINADDQSWQPTTNTFKSMIFIDRQHAIKIIEHLKREFNI